MPVTLLGVDIGTTGCKVVAVDSEGWPLLSAYREYRLATPRPGWAELDPDEVWGAVCSAIREVTAALPERPRALAVATLGEAVTPIDASGAALAPTILSFDGRARACYEHLVGALGAARLTSVCGVEPQPHYSVAKWSWIAREMPETYRRAATLACFGDLCAVRLGLPPVIDHTMATRTLAFDAAGGSWSPEVLDAAGLDIGKLPTPAPTGTVVGAVAARQARELGLADGAVLVTGGLDQVCAAYGAGIGAEDDGSAMLSLGTVAVLAAVLRADESGRNSVPTVPYRAPGERLAIAGTPAGGAVLRWYRDRFGAAEAAAVAGAEDEFYDRIVAGAADVETDLIALPHFAGSRTAFADPQATAALIGLTFATETRHIVRALLEGVALETAAMAGRLTESGAAVTSLRAVGGGSRSPVWMQIFADVLEVPVESTASAEAAAVGAALIAGAATGVGAGDGRGLPLSRRYEPEESAGRGYRAKLTRYHDLHGALAAVRDAGR
ncbi:MAG: FGGY family carbohydrate kinase [bacterium]|nr:FGGY family carbohydrate kinase [bacterium]